MESKLSKIASLLLTALSIFLLLCLLSYDPADIPLLSSHPQRPTLNLGGIVGAWVGFALRGGFGWSALILPFVGLLWSWRIWNEEENELHSIFFALAAMFFLVSMSTLFGLSGGLEAEQVSRGGMVGFVLGDIGRYYFGQYVYGLAILGTLLSWLIISGTQFEQSVTAWLESAGSAIGAFWDAVFLKVSSIRFKLPRLRRAQASAEDADEAEDAYDEDEEEDEDEAEYEDDEEYEEDEEDDEEYEDEDDEEAEDDEEYEEDEDAYEDEEGDEELVEPGIKRSGRKPNIRIRSTGRTKGPTAKRQSSYRGFKLPPLDLLEDPPPISEEELAEDLQQHAKILEETLEDFGVEAEVVNIDRGPTVTRYELVPAAGVKLTKVISLADELALTLKVASCHIVAPLPGKGTIGIDVPNLTTTTVYLKEILTLKEFVKHPSPLALPIGKDVAGKPVIADLAECPHLLIAGATGSGKTVCLNSLLIGILSHTSPEQVRLMMIDPKMVELASFNGIPHLVAPVVTNPKKAAAALQWAVNEMERRYRLLATVGARNITSFNKKVTEPGFKPPVLGEDDESGAQASDYVHLPFLVVLIDELADLMLVASQDVESSIARLAQMSRAVGIHVILATQRPSVDVITGVIKANFPARIAFQVSSKVDSRTILDANGADKLLGRGDLLFLPPGKPKPVRVQGTFVTDAEIENVTQFLKRQRKPDFNMTLMEKQNKPASSGVDELDDDLYDEAKNLVLDTGQASTSYLQRRLRIGYGRAARLLDQLEDEGIVGPPQGSKGREILISRSAVQRGN